MKKKIELKNGGFITVGEWEISDRSYSDVGKTYKIKVGRGWIYLSQQESVKFADGKIIPTGEYYWSFVCSFGADSDESYSGAIAKNTEYSKNLESAKQYIENVVITTVSC